MYEDRIIELETKISYQEDLLQDLNNLVVDQQHQIDQLTILTNSLSKQLKEVMFSIHSNSNVDEKPPHY